MVYVLLHLKKVFFKNLCKLGVVFILFQLRYLHDIINTVWIAINKLPSDTQQNARYRYSLRSPRAKIKFVVDMFHFVKHI